MRARIDHEELSSGKRIIREFDAAGQMISEGHAYGLIDISIKRYFSAGVKTAEVYIVNKRMVSRKRYEQAREKYDDMPPADPTVEDFSAKLLKGIREERRQWSQAAKAHVPDRNAAAKADEFCRSMLNKGKTATARVWIKSRKHSLGELSHSRSRRITERLFALGARRIQLCDIDEYDGGEENTGHLVIELPKDPEKRKSLFREVDRLAATQGCRGELDNGQRYLYVGLD